MPILSRFFGIIITMNYREHGPPHFHAWYASHEVTVKIGDGTVTGEMPKRALGLIIECLECTAMNFVRTGSERREAAPHPDRSIGVAMHYTVTDARHVKDYTIWLRFADETEGEVDLSEELWGPMFEPLRDLEFFKKFEVAEYGTLAWPNGADLAPEFLHSRARVVANS